jgi:ATP-dependent helicase/nuclease subunit B
LRPRVLFLGGLSRDAFPAPARVDPFLSDADRRRIGLPCRADRLEEALHLFGLALASPSERTVLSFPASGEPEDAESTFLSELRLHVAGLTSPPEARPPRCERERQALVARGSAAALAARPYPPEADLLAALESEVARAGPLSGYDGLLSPAAAERLDFGPAHAFSATQLELYAICPFKFFARHVLEILPLSEPDLEIAAEERGDIVHEILARFYRGEREAGRRPGAAWIEGAAARLGEVARAVLEARVLRDDLFARRFAEGLLRGIDGRGRPGVLRKFVEWEASDDGGFTPSLFEARFGRLAGPGDLLAAEPVEIAPGVRLAGSIDRIDLGGSDRLRLFDYKTGAYLPRPADLREGIRLQIPLYLVAAAEILGRDPVAGGIYRVRDGAPVGPDRLLRDRAGNADLPRRLSEALVRTREAAARITASMREGRFHPGHLSPERKGCDFCELRAVCRVDHDRMERLFEERAPGLFAPLALWERS